MVSSAPSYPLVTGKDGYTSKIVPLPNPGSAFFFFGLKTQVEGGFAHVVFKGPQDKHFLVSFSTGVSGDITFDTRGLGDKEGLLVSRTNMQLKDKSFTWFTLYRKHNTLALYHEGYVGPILMYKSNDPKMEFLSFDRVSVSAPSAVATMDIVGKWYKPLEKKQKKLSTKDPNVLKELKYVKSALKRRRISLKALALAKKLFIVCKKVKRSSLRDIEDSELSLKNTMLFFNQTDMPRIKKNDYKGIALKMEGHCNYRWVKVRNPGKPSMHGLVSKRVWNRYKKVTWKQKLPDRYINAWSDVLWYPKGILKRKIWALPPRDLKVLK